MGKGRFILFLLLVVGLALLAGSIYVGHQRYEFVRAAHAVTGQVVDQRYDPLHTGAKRDRHYPIVRFTLPSGAIIRTELTDTSSRTLYVVGRQMPLLYVQMPGRPIKVRSGALLDLWQTPLAMALVGLIFAIPFILFTRSSRGADARRARLRASGQRIEAKLSGVITDDSEQIMGRSAYRIEATWKNPKDGAEVTFRSDRIWTDPTPRLRGGTVTVYINPADPGDYSVDLSFLPK